jgi:hypothetical protein
MYHLYAEDLSQLGTPGAEMPRLIDNYYKSIAHAMEQAEEHFGARIVWKPKPNGSMSSGDLGWVMYHIKYIHPED